MIDKGMAPSEVFLALWRQWARTDKSGVEDFTACAEAWAEIRRMEAETARREFFGSINPDPAPIPSFWTEKGTGKTDSHAPAGLGMTETKEPEDAGGASPSPTEENETARVYSAYVDYTGEMHGPTEGPLPTKAPEEGVQSGPEAEPDPSAVKKGPWRHRRERVQKRLLATRFSTQAIVDRSGREVTAGDVRTFADDCDALPARKVGAIEDALNALEGTV